LVSLLTDFGTNDAFVAEVKAVIFSICPEAQVIDITHEVDRSNVRMGAFLLASAAPHFPTGTVHLAIVDPGVGSERRPIVVETRRSIYVGPDNGLLVPAAKVEGVRHVYELTNQSLMSKTISSTFHGRDIFAPAAAHFACGTKANEAGEEIPDYIQLSFGNPNFHEYGASCEVIHVDHFGNIVTNIPNPRMNRFKESVRFLAAHRKKFRARFVKSYTEIREGEFGLFCGSQGFVEIARRESSASKRLRTQTGDKIRLSTR
jgi:S-adenosylmethionine hydrolase